MMRTAAIDIGTNTVRLLIADYEGEQRFTPILRKEVITRLGGGFSAEGKILADAMDRTLGALVDFKEAMIKYGVTKTLAVATSVVREARNGKDFIEKVREETGIKIVTISGETEAKLACQGALLPVDCAYDRAFIFDIGGGSTEFILTQGTELIKVESIDLGVVHLTECYLHHDPPQKEELATIEKIIRSKIEEVREYFQTASLYPFNPGAKVILIGIAGTPTTIAAIDLKLTEYDREMVTNHLLDRERIKEIFQKLTIKTAAERLLLPGLQKGREDLIIPGILIVKGVMKSFGFSVLKVIDSGILEGIILSSISF